MTHLAGEDDCQVLLLWVIHLQAPLQAGACILQQQHSSAVVSLSGCVVFSTCTSSLKQHGSYVHTFAANGACISELIMYTTCRK
jgi:hypothetical protein